MNLERFAGIQPFRRYVLVATLLGAIAPLCGSVAAFAQYGPPDQEQPQGQETNPSGRVGRLAYLQGTVSIEPNGVSTWSEADPNYPIATGDRVYTDESGRAEVSIGSLTARMSSTTDLTMTNLTDQIVQLGLAQGTVRIHVYDMPPGNQVEVDTPNGAITLNQPGEFRVDVPANDGATIVVVNQGNVEVSGPNLSQEIGQGNAVEMTGTNPVYLNALAFPGFDRFDDWCIQRDRHILGSRSREYVSADMPGFDDLDDYGSWQPDTEYGPVWYPSGVEAGYVPYQNGHWIWVDPYGWTWVDAAPWGYAPFHYGRWAYIGSRWGWVPGPIRVRPYWAPALVAFAGGGGGGFAFGVGFAAWFPLGVGEPYIPAYHCGPTYIRNINVTNINITNIHNTTIVNNYNTFVRSSNNYTNIHNNVAVNYQNRVNGFTAVNGRAFAAGQPVRGNIAHVPPQAIQATTVIAHPSVMPTRQSIVPRPLGRPVPVSVARPTLLTRTGKEQQATPGARPVAVPYKPLPANQQRPAVPAQNGRPIAQAPGRPAGNAPVPDVGHPQPGERPTVPTQAERPNPVAVPVQSRPAPFQNRPTAVVPQPRPLINRSSPPVPQPTFKQQQPAFKTDPGRPLEPQQKENLRQGMPAGRPQDTEPLPHAPFRPAPMPASRPAPMPAPRPAPAPQARPAPQPRPEPAARPAPAERPAPQPRGGEHH